MHTELAGFGEQRIVDIGDVANTFDGVTHVDEATLQDVVDDERCCMAEMRGVVRRDAARVHLDIVIGLEGDDCLPCSVIEADRHCASIYGR